MAAFNNHSCLPCTSITFAVQKTYPVGNYPFGIVAGNFNGTSGLDLAVVNQSDSNVTVLFNNGSGVFNSQVTFAVGILPLDIATAVLTVTANWTRIYK